MELTSKPVRTSFDRYMQLCNWCFSGNVSNFLAFGAVSVLFGMFCPASVVVISIALALGACSVLQLLVGKQDRMALVPVYAFFIFFAVFSLMGAFARKARATEPIAMLSTA